MDANTNPSTKATDKTMKIRNIKKKLKRKVPLSKKEGRLFTTVIGKCKSIRNTLIRGMVSMGNYNGAVSLMIKHGDMNLSTGWELND